MADFAEGEAELLAAARAGSAEAIGQVLESCRNYLLLVAERHLDPKLRAKGGASDLVQETFLEAQRDFSGFHGSTEQELLAWLSRVLLNNLGNHYRRYGQTDKRDFNRELPLQTGDSSAEIDKTPAAPQPSPSQAAMQQEQAEALGRAIERLPAHYRQVVIMRYQEERSFEEIGAAIGCSAEAARKLWSRAMEKLRLDCEDLS
jgi:RNA polymerase sigma-70 factor (ECF subfamily)